MYMKKKRSIKSFVFGENADIKPEQILGGYGNSTTSWDPFFGNCSTGGGVTFPTGESNATKPSHGCVETSYKCDPTQNGCPKPVYPTEAKSGCTPGTGGSGSETTPRYCDPNYTPTAGSYTQCYYPY